MIQQRYYAGIGSRNTPADQLQEMEKLAVNLANAGWLLRSGGAAGADSAFERGAKSVDGHGEIYTSRHTTQAAMDAAEAVHPAWDRCSMFAKRLHGRNMFQIMGQGMKGPNSSFVLCWTPDGAQTEEECSIKTGGTATAIRLASRLNIPVFNIQRGGRQVQFAFSEFVLGQ